MCRVQIQLAQVNVRHNAGLLSFLNHVIRTFEPFARGIVLGFLQCVNADFVAEIYCLGYALSIFKFEGSGEAREEVIR